MHILISGKHASPVAAIGEELKSRWAALGTAVYCYNAKTPALLMRDALHSIAAQFGPVPEDDPDLFLQQALLDWGRERDLQYWGKVAKRSVDNVTKNWEDMGLFHVAVIQNLCFREDYELFPRAFRVYVLPKSSVESHMIHGHHSSETDLDGWVTEHKSALYPIFDLVLSEDQGSVQDLAGHIFSGFNERFKSGFRKLFN